jgi:ferritin-like metal-binding protein YciE
MTARSELINWLQDAYAMERGMEITLRVQAESAELPPDTREAIRLHMHETHAHAAAIKDYLGGIGIDASTSRTRFAQTIGVIRTLGSMFLLRDEPIKNALAAYAAEHFEIECYKALRMASLAANEKAIAALCDRILPDEVRMALWLDDHLPGLIAAHARGESVAHAA